MSLRTIQREPSSTKRAKRSTRRGGQAYAVPAASAQQAAHISGEALTVTTGIEQLAVLVKAHVGLQALIIREDTQLFSDGDEGVRHTLASSQRIPW